MSQFLARLFGGSPTRVIIKLLLLSALVGLLLSKMGWKALDVLPNLWQLCLDLFYWSYSSFGEFFDMLLAGVIIVVPIFIMRRLLRGEKNS